MMLSDRTCQRCAFHRWAFFLASYCFPVIAPKIWSKLRKWGPKYVFGERWLLNGKKFQKFAKKWFMRTMSCVFLPSLVEIGKAKSPNRCMVFVTNKIIEKVSFWPLSPASLEQSHQKFCNVTLCYCSYLCQVSSKSIQFLRDMREIVVYIISVMCFLLTTRL